MSKKCTRDCLYQPICFTDCGGTNSKEALIEMYLKEESLEQAKTDCDKAIKEVKNLLKHFQFYVINHPTDDFASLEWRRGVLYGITQSLQAVNNCKKL